MENTAPVICACCDQFLVEAKGLQILRHGDAGLVFLLMDRAGQLCCLLDLVFLSHWIRGRLRRRLERSVEDHQCVQICDNHHLIRHSM